MNVFDFALQMELDGEQFYRELAKKAKYTNLQVVLQSLADDEQRHYKIVWMLQNQIFSYYSSEDASISSAQSVFEPGKVDEFISKDKDAIAKLKGEQIDVYRAALLKEEESVQLYKKLKAATEKQVEKDILDKLMQEEERHAEVLDNIIQMFNHVNEWVESAEFFHQKPY